MKRNIIVLISVTISIAAILGNSLIVLGKENPVSNDGASMEEKAKDVAEKFVKNSPTYNFDGFDLKYVETLYPDIVDCPNCWTFVFEFNSKHAGYGNREGEILAQVITPHEAHVTIVDGEIENANLDQKWDMVEQVML